MEVSFYIVIKIMVLHILFTNRKKQNETIKRNKKYRISNSILKSKGINDIIYVVGGMNHGRSYRKNRKYNN